VSALKLRHVIEAATKRRKSAAVDPAKCCRGRGRLDTRTRTRPSAVRLLRICLSQQWWAGLAAGYVDLGQGYDGVMQQIIWQGSKGLI
jgi:hypothetical protein